MGQCFARLAPLIGSLALLGCAASAPRMAVNANLESAATPSSLAQQKAFEALRENLNAVRDLGDPIDALTPETVKVGRAQIAQLPPAELNELLRSDGQAAKQHPIYYLLAGGHELSVLARVQYNGEADLVALWRAAGNTDLHGLLAPAHELARRVAAHWLVRTAAQLHTAKDVDVTTCDQVENIANYAGLVALSRSAVDMAITLEPNGPRWLKVADAAATALDIPKAREAVARAKSSDSKGSQPLPVQASEDRLKTAEVALLRADSAVSSEDLLKKARALVDLGRYSDVIDLLRPRAERVKADAGLATTLLSATFSYLVDHRCPKGGELAQTCIASLDDEATMKEAVAWAREAWSSGNGRDGRAATLYIGLLGLMPVAARMTSARQQDENAARADIVRYLEAVEKDVDDAVGVAPELAGLHLYAETMRHFTDEPKAGTVWPSPAARADFEARALDIAKHHGHDAWGQTGVVFAASLLSLDGNAVSLVDALPAEIDPSLRLVRAKVELWAAVVEHDERAVDLATTALLASMPTEAEDPAAHSSYQLLISEAQALTKGSGAAYEALGEVARKIIESPSSPELRVRSIIDRAGALSRAHDTARAVALLRSITAQDAAAAERSNVIATTYGLVLEAKAANGAERKRIIAELEKHTTEPHSTLWKEAWTRELTFESATEGCPADSVCVRKAAKSRKLPAAKLDGPWLAGLPRHGGLYTGDLTSGIGWSDLGGMFARVEFNFTLPAVEFPVN